MRFYRFTLREPDSTLPASESCLPVPDSRYQFSIQVVSRYLQDQSDPDRELFSFAYTVSITNTGNVAAQLISRHWLIRDGRGSVVEVKGLGVVGHQPLLEPGQRFEYTSGSQIGTPVGSMTGSYFFVAEDGHRFETAIPEFGLSVPRTLH
jgi:ApaG protein